MEPMCGESLSPTSPLHYCQAFMECGLLHGGEDSRQVHIEGN